jgi:tetratricopeptide (TPR) repeat protein
MFTCLDSKEKKAVAMNSREAEAAALMKSAKKHHTKSFTKWKEDWDSAAVDYEKAAQIYTHMNKKAEATEAWNRCSEAHEKAKNIFLAGKACDSLGNYLKDNDDPAAAFTAFCRAGRMYALDSKPERQAEALQRAARSLPPDRAAEANKVLLEAIQCLEDGEKWYMAPDIFRMLIIGQLRAGQHADAITTIKREIKTFLSLQQQSNCARAMLEVVVICLAIGDTVLAEREFKEFGQVPGVSGSKEQGLAYDLIQAVDQGNEKLLVELQKEQLFSFLVPEVARMVKKLKCNARPIAAVPSAAPGGEPAVGAPPTGEEDCR